MVTPQVIHESAARGELVYPGAAWLPIPEQQTQPRIIVSQLIFHSMAGPRLTSLEALRAYMGRDDVHVECTAMSDMDGRMAQLVEANVRADCNYKANVRAISVETQDEGSPTLASTPWTPIQLEQHAGFAAWCHLRFSVPLRFPPTWDSPGVGYHRLYAEWSNVTGKTCPGDTRISQMPALLARAREIAAWSPPTPDPDPEDDMEPPYVIVPKGVWALWWFPHLYVGTADRRATATVSGEIAGTVPRLECTDAGQYRRKCDQSNIQLMVELP
jgi:hypothetical protein